MTSVETGNSHSEIDLHRRLLLQRMAAGASLAVAAGSPVLAQNAPAGAAAPAPQPEPEPDATTAKFISLLSELSNWNRWGPDDQMGTVNLITPAVRKAALALAREGVTFSMERDLELTKTADNPTPIVLTVTRAGKGQVPTKFKGGGTADTQLMNYHNFVVTHMNALSHFLYDGKMYNNRSQDLVTKEDGAIQNNIMAFKNGIVTRGVLMDMARHKGVDYLDPGTAIFPEDLDAWEKKARVKIGAGDVILVRTGRWARRDAKGPWPVSEGLAGLHVSCAKWMHARDVAILGGDDAQDVLPSRVEGVSQPVHTLALVAMGMPIFDNLDLELIGREADRRKRWEFLVTAAPAAVPGATGSVLNPIATF
jgi:kynurenine formamidase